LRVESFLEASATTRPEAIALECRGRRLTYEELDAQAARFGRALASLGVTRGDRVAIHLDNSIEAVISIFATLKAGLVFVVLNPTMKAEKLAFILRDCQAAALIADLRRAAIVMEALSGTSGPRIIVWTGDETPVRPAGASFEELTARHTPENALSPAHGIDRDLAALVYTSGSTGTPKGVMLTHVNIVSACEAITSYLENTADDVILNVLPLSFDYGLYQVLMACRVGARLILERSFAYPHDVLSRIGRDGVTGFPIVPTIAALLLASDLSLYDFSRLRYITNTGAALPTPHIAALRQSLPHVRLYSMYGLTECKRVSFLAPEEIDDRPTSVGKPMRGVEVLVADGEESLHRSGVGELVVRGANVMQGYWGQPDETARALRMGLLPGEKLLYTGDIFRIDDNGYLYFVGRTDDIIKSRGEKVSPREVENVLCELNGVAEALVVGVPDPILGQAVKAFVRLGHGSELTEQHVRRHCARKLEDFMIPRHINFVETLPRTSSGKVDRLALPVHG
jgi:long-chain acyl-CoA synthetase